jgi:hypothetical protein
MSTEANSVVVPLTNREIEYVISWKSETFWPDEARLIAKLKRALGSDEPLQLSRLQTRLIHGWAEEQMDGPYGRSASNIEERTIVQKLQNALEAN